MVLFLVYEKKEYVEVFSVLLKVKNIDINKQEPEEGDTSLIYAIRNNKKELAHMLINSPKTDINIARFDTHTALTAAVICEMDDIVSEIINHHNFDHELSNLNLAFLILKNEQTQKIVYQVKYLDVNYQIDSIFFNFRQNNGEKCGIKKDDLWRYNNMSNFFISPIEKTLTYSVKSNDLQKFDMILNHPSFDSSKSQISTAIFDSSDLEDDFIF